MFSLRERAEGITRERNNKMTDNRMTLLYSCFFQVFCMTFNMAVARGKLIT